MVSQLPQRVARILSVSGSLLCLHEGKPTVILIHYANIVLFSQQIPLEQSKNSQAPSSIHLDCCILLLVSMQVTFPLFLVF